MSTSQKLYFERKDTPQSHSPTAEAMRALLTLDPSIGFEAARDLVNRVGASLKGTKACAREALEILRGAK